MVKDSRMLIAAVHLSTAALLTSAVIVGGRVGSFIHLALPRAQQAQIGLDPADAAATGDELNGDGGNGDGGDATDSTAQGPTQDLRPAKGGVAADGTFSETFDGTPNAPQPWAPANWDVTVHSRNTSRPDTLDPIDAMHGPDCGAPPATHTNDSFSGAVFICKDHMMTAIKGEDYAAIYLTPDAMVDVSGGTARISFDISTLTTSNRDWWDVWVSPYDEQLQTPLEEWLPDLNGSPRHAVHVRLNDAGTVTASTYREFEETKVPAITNAAYDTVLTPDAKRRDTFVIELSATHLRVGMPQYDLWWIDSDIDALPFDRGVVQFGHHSYNPLKDCDPATARGPGGTCGPNTWHWDNVTIAPAVAFTIDRATSRVADARTPRVTLAAPSPADGHLRFTAVGDSLEFSIDGGTTWTAATQQAVDKPQVPEHFMSFWTPLPAGTEQILFRGKATIAGDWIVRDVSVWSPT